MKIKAVFDHISRNEGISIDEVAKNLGVAKSTLYYSINKDELSLKLKSKLREIYPNYLYLLTAEETEEYDLNKIASIIVKKEEELLKIDKFRLWLETKVQKGVIDVLSIKNEN